MRTIYSTRNLKTECCTADNQTGKSNTNISGFFGVNLRTVQRIQKDLDESIGDYKGMAVRKPYFGRSDKKITPELVAEIQALIAIDPGLSIMSIARDMGRASFLSGRWWIKTFVISHTWEMKGDQFSSQTDKKK